MNTKSSPWLGVSIALLVLLLVICIVTVSLLAALAPSIAPFFTYSNPPSTLLQPTLQPTPNIKCPNGNCANACLSRLADFLQPNSITESLPRSNFQHSHEINPVLLVTYRLVGGQLGNPQFSSKVPLTLLGLQQDTKSQEKIWNYFAAIIPADQRPPSIHLPSPYFAMRSRAKM